MTIAAPLPGITPRWLGGQIDWRIELDTGLAGESFGIWDVGLWDQATWGSEDPNWVDIGKVESISTTQGAEKGGERFETGTATIVVDNQDGRFSPDSGISPTIFHLPFRPGRRVRVVAIPDPDNPTIKVARWTGALDSTSDQYDEGGAVITTTFNCLDYMARWGIHNPPALDTPTGVQTTHARVAAALDRMSWPAGDRDIQTGLHTMQSSHLAQTTLEECGAAADAEGGAFFCSPDGKATFKARDWLTTDTRSTVVQGYLGYDTIPTGANSAPIVTASVQPAWEAAQIVNLVEFARVGSTMQRVEDTPSQALYDIRSYQRTDLQNNADSEVLFLAQRHLDRYKISRSRINSVTISGVDDPLNLDLNRLLWDTQFGDLLMIKVKTLQGWEFEKLVQVMGISYQISGDDVEVTFRLDDATPNEESS